MYGLASKKQKPRLMADEKLGASDFKAIADELGATIRTARKIGFIAARKAEKGQTVETLWNGVESTAKAVPGDYIVTNLTPDKAVLRDAQDNANTYVIKAQNFSSLYERATGANEFGEIYQAISIVEALFLAGGFEIMAPWGEVQRADEGYLILSRIEVYGNHKETFETTYEFV